MPDEHDRALELARYRVRAARARARAGQAGAAADHHERSAREGPVQLRAMHRSVADAHRGTQRRHLAVVALYDRHARSIEERDASGTPELPGLVESVAEACGSRSAYLTLRTARGAVMVVASDETADAVHEAEAVLAEGPSLDCVGTGPVLARDGQLRTRWPLLAGAIEPFGVAALASVPLRAGDTAIGSLTAVATGAPHVGTIDLPRLDAVGEGVLEVLTAELEGPNLGATSLLGNLDAAEELHQAAGMLAVRLGLRVDDAVALLHARAFATGTDVCSLAAAVLAGTTTLDP